MALVLNCDASVTNATRFLLSKGMACLWLLLTQWILLSCARVWKKAFLYRLGIVLISIALYAHDVCVVPVIPPELNQKRNNFFALGWLLKIQQTSSRRNSATASQFHHRGVCLGLWCPLPEHIQLSNRLLNFPYKEVKCLSSDRSK